MQRSDAMRQLRADADPVVWANVSCTMRGVEVRDSIVFRAGAAGPGWRIAARMLGVAALAWTARRSLSQTSTKRAAAT